MLLQSVNESVKGIIQDIRYLGMLASCQTPMWRMVVVPWGGYLAARLATWLAGLARAGVQVQD